MKNIPWLFVFFLSMGNLYTCKSSQTRNVVTLKDGTVVHGVMKVFESSNLQTARDIVAFYGIPYAKPPVGPLRFKPSVPIEHIESPYNASAVGNSCLQDDVGGVFELTNENKSEDCLTLNVFVPKPSGKSKGVLVWIHGGMFMFGAGQMEISSPLSLIGYGDIIFVTMNYRLGPLGFLTSGDDLIPGNLGLRDQQLALKWIHENIRAFGGNPSRITIMGHGSGSASVGYHILSPGSKGLFTNAIMESGSPISPLSKGDLGAAYHRREVKTLAKLIGCDDIEDDKRLLACLQKAPAEDIIETLPLAQQELGNDIKGPIKTTIDGVFMPKDVMSMLKDGQLNVRNLLIGSNADEGTLHLVLYFQDMEVKPFVNLTTFDEFLSLLDMKHPLFRELLSTVYVPKPIHLGNKSRNYFDELSQIVGDMTIGCGVASFANEVHSSAPSTNVYRYRMIYEPSNTFTGAKWSGASHGDELQFVFGAPFEEALYKKTSDEEKEFSRKVMKYWSNFVKTGNPNTGYGDSEENLPWWPNFVTGDELCKELSSSMRARRNEKQRHCHLINNIIPELKKVIEELDNLKTAKDAKSKWAKEGQCADGVCHA